MNGYAKCLGTSNHGFAQYAQEEIRRLFPSVKFTLIVPTELFLFEVQADLQEVLETLKGQEPIFLRHVQPVHQEWELTRSDEDLTAIREWVQHSGQALGLLPGISAAVQVRKEERAELPYAPFAVKAAVEEVLTLSLQVEPVVRHADRIISVFLGSNKLYAGVSRPQENLSDWSGGAIRFQKEEDQISRAKFKLLEAEQRFGLDFTHARTALDIGAAPGGWTSFLLERGLRVTAIDPAHMHPSLLGNPMLTVYKKNAGDVKLRQDEFDLLVCDMSWSPRQMGRLVADLLYALKSGGTAIITVKLMHKKPFQTIRELMHMFGDDLELIKAKQLFHNREELTLYLRKK